MQTERLSRPATEQADRHEPAERAPDSEAAGGAARDGRAAALPPGGKG